MSKAEIQWALFNKALILLKKHSTVKKEGNFLLVDILRKSAICNPRDFKFCLQATNNHEDETIVLNIARIEGKNPVSFDYDFTYPTLEAGEKMMEEILKVFEHIYSTYSCEWFE